MLVRCCFIYRGAAFYTHALKASTHSQGVRMPWTERKAKFQFLWSNCIKCLCFALNHQNHAFWIIGVKNKNSLLFFLNHSLFCREMSCSLLPCPSIFLVVLPLSHMSLPIKAVTPFPFPQQFSDGWPHSISLSMIYFHKSTCSLWRIPGSLGPSSSYANLSHSIVHLT